MHRFAPVCTHLLASLEFAAASADLLGFAWFCRDVLRFAPIRFELLPLGGFAEIILICCDSLQIA